MNIFDKINRRQIIIFTIFYIFNFTHLPTIVSLVLFSYIGLDYLVLEFMGILGIFNPDVTGFLSLVFTLIALILSTIINKNILRLTLFQNLSEKKALLLSIVISSVVICCVGLAVFHPFYFY